jgi:hypothetical protein
MTEVYNFDEEAMARVIRAVRKIEGMAPAAPAMFAAQPQRSSLSLGFYAVATADLGGRKWAGSELVLSAATGIFAVPAYGGRTWSGSTPIIVPGPKPKVGDLLRLEMVGGGEGKHPAFVGTALQEMILDNMDNPAAATKLIRRRHTPTGYVDDTIFEFPQCQT